MAAMMVLEFCDIFEALYAPNTSWELARDQFRELGQDGMVVQAYPRHFMELSLFSLEEVANDALRVDRFR